MQQFHKLNRYNEAIESYSIAIQINPNYLSAHNNKGLALFDLSRYNEAIESFNKALQIDPNDLETNFNKAVALTKFYLN